MKNLKWIIVIALCTFSVACSEFLEEQSQDEVHVTTVVDYSEVLLNYMGENNNYDILTFLSDNVKMNESKLNSWNDTPIKSHFGCFTWQPDMWEGNYSSDSRYEYVYRQIMGVNAVLDGIDEASGDQIEKEYVKAEALAMRGFYYLMLINYFGEPYNVNKQALGVPLKLESVLYDHISRNTVVEVYEQIVKDFNASLTLFEKYPKRRRDYRINLTTVQILLSRTYLYMEDWEEAVNSANEAIESSEGLTNYTTLSGVFYMPRYEHSEVEWLYATYNSSIKGNLSPSDDFISLYDPNDYRLKFWFSADKKQILKWDLPSVDFYDPRQTIRISEAYLNRAEANARQNNNTEALNDLNELRKNRIKDYNNVSITNQQELIDEILKERRLELCFDGHRWFDLRRTGMPSIKHRFKLRSTEEWETYTLKANDPLYTLPLPLYLFENNSQLEQNASANTPTREKDVE